MDRKEGFDMVEDLFFLSNGHISQFSTAFWQEAVVQFRCYFPSNQFQDS
jgi:hypothetical protein